MAPIFYQIYEMVRKPREMFEFIEHEFGLREVVNEQIVSEGLAEEIGMGAHLIGKTKFVDFPSDLQLKLSSLGNQFIIVADDQIENFEDVLKKLKKRRKNQTNFTYPRTIPKLHNEYLPIIFAVDV